MEQREMTVYRARGTSVEENKPLIMLQGKWLRDMGFSTGGRMCTTKRLSIALGSAGIGKWYE